MAEYINLGAGPQGPAGPTGATGPQGPAGPTGATGKLLQELSATSTTSAALTALMGNLGPPSSSSGTEILSRSITPSSTSNLIRGEVNVNFSFRSSSSLALCGIYQGATLVKLCVVSGSSTQFGVFTLIFEDEPATTSPVTYTVRVGAFSGNGIYLNSSWDGGNDPATWKTTSNLILREVAP